MISRSAIAAVLRHCSGNSSQMSRFRYSICRLMHTYGAQTQRSRGLTCLPSHSIIAPRLRIDQWKLMGSSGEANYNSHSCQRESESTGPEHGITSLSMQEATAKESISGLEVVERIMAELRTTGKTFILPVNDAAAMEAITEPFKLLLDIGILPEFIVDACICVPKLFTSLTQKGQTSIQIIELIVDFCQLTYEDSIRIFATYNEELIAAGPEEIQKCMEVLESYGLEDEKMGAAVCSCPSLLFALKSNRLAQNAENLFSHFSKNQLHALLSSSPELLLGKTDEAEDKIEYIYCHMLMEGEDFAGCTKLAEISLNELMDRHEFLLKTGIYKTPNPKRPQLKMENPKLRKILDSSAGEFAAKIAQVSVQEWNLFRELQDKRRALEAEGIVRPFERIKPSMRKQTERRKKIMSPSDSDTFESYNERY